MTLKFENSRYGCFPRNIRLLEEFTGMAGKQFVMLLHLCIDADDFGNGRKYSNRDLAKAIKIHPNKLPKLRTSLVDLGLLTLERVEGGYRYFISDPVSRRPVNEKVPQESADDWLPTAAPDVTAEIAEEAPVQIATEPAGEIVPEAPREIGEEAEVADLETLKKIYESLSEKTPEEVELSLQIRQCRKDPERVAELKEQRAALEAQRKQKKEQAKRKYELAGGVIHARQEYGADANLQVSDD